MDTKTHLHSIITDMMIKHGLDPTEYRIRLRSRWSYWTILEQQLVDRVSLVEYGVLNITNRVRRQFVELVHLLTYQEVKKGWNDSCPAESGEAFVDNRCELHPNLTLFLEAFILGIDAFD